MNHYQKTLLLRFLSYFFILFGTLTLILIVEPVSLEEIKFDLGQVFGRQKTLPRIITSSGEVIPGNNPAINSSNVSNNISTASGFADLTISNDNNIIPLSTDFGIVIEKIGANAKIIPDVDPSNERAYMNALKEGIAKAQGTVNPGEKGNLYLFSHSVSAPWEVIRYNAVFYLLGKLEVGDKIIIFYKGRRYDYIVFDKKVVPASDTEYLTASYDFPVLTLQTCDPPGTTWKRLIVRAKLEGVQY